jgi:D-arginine dehydrogenase
MEAYDFIIVGGGIAGASAGYALAEHARVILIERESQFGYHSTGRSAAVFLKSHGPEVIRALATGSKEFLLNPPDGFTETPLLRPRGILFIGRADQVPLLDHQAAECARFISGVRRLDARETRAMAPILREEYVAGAVYDPEAMDLDVHAIHQGFLRGMRAHGGKTLTGAELIELKYAGGAWTAVTAAGSFSAPVVINAAGAWCDKVARIAGVRTVGLVPKRRTAFVFEPPVGLDCRAWPGIHDIGERFYFKPDAGKLLASPADETPMEPCDVYPDDLDVAIAVDRIQQAANLPVTRIDRKWAGLRSFVADGCPVVGYDPEAAGFFWIAGQGGYGIETSVGMGRLSASLARGQGVPGDLASLGVRAETVAPGRLTRG